MSTRPETAAQVWNTILPEIRATRRNRRNRRIAAAAGVVLLGSWLALRPALRPSPVPAAIAVSVTVPVAAPVPVVERLAVYRVADNGSVWLEEVAPQDLGPTELTLGLSPIILCGLPQDW
jgi:hypothetical protein